MTAQRLRPSGHDRPNHNDQRNDHEEDQNMTKPISYQRTTIVNRPADEVWAYVADYAFDLQWRDGLTDMTPSPVGPPQTGTTVHEEIRSMGTTMVNDTTVTMIGEHAYRFIGGGPSGQVEGGREVIALDPNRSEFSYGISLTLHGPIRFLGFILRPILSRKLQTDLDRFRALAEADTKVVNAGSHVAGSTSRSTRPGDEIR